MTSDIDRKKLVIIGAGFGGIAAAKALKHAPMDIEIIDRRNYHLFQPLLYQVATADLSPADIAWPIRSMFAAQKNVAVTMSEVIGINRTAKIVTTADKDIAYDYLIIATGAEHSYFGNDAWADHAPGLKKLVDATEIRRRILLAFEQAELSDDPVEQARHMTFAVVGAGPTGVELAGAIAELAHFTLAKDFRKIRPQDARVILIEAGPRVLASFPEDLSDKAHHALEELGVEVALNSMVKDIQSDCVKTAKEEIPCSTSLWAAGVQVPSIGTWLKVETDRAGRVPVLEDLRITPEEPIFVIGDAASVPWERDHFVPGIAPAAKQMGAYAANVIKSEIANTTPPTAFKYKHAGNLATIGRNAAVIDFGWIKLSGRLAWWLWGIAHIYFLIGVRQPILVAINWFWSYLTYSKGARLITGAKSQQEYKTTKHKSKTTNRK